MNFTENFEKLSELTKDIKFCMLTTTDIEGLLRSRPLTTQSAGLEDCLWFFISAAGTLSDELRNSPNVNLSYTDPNHNRYVSVSGKAEVIRDRAKAEKMWNPTFKAWFPEGLDDPNLALLKIEVEQAEYWDAPSSRLVQIEGFLKASTTSERVEKTSEHKAIH